MRAGFTLAVVTLAAATAVAAVTFGTAGPAAYERPPAPAAVGAFRDGGTPRHDPVVEAAFDADLPALMEWLWSGATTEAERSRRFAVVRDHPAFTRHGAGLRDAWRGLVVCLEAWWRTSARGGAAISVELRARAGAVSDQLAAAELGYYVDAAIDEDVGDGELRPGLVGYRIERVAFVRTNEQRVRVLDARRLDPSRPGTTVLGLKSDQELDDPVVVLDAVEAKVERQLMPVLDGATFPIGSSDGWRPRVPLGRAAAAAIRRELTVALYDAVSSAPRAELQTRTLVTESVRRHEAQHLLDQLAGLAHATSLDPHLEGASPAFALRARFEMSAYLSQLASDVWLPQLTLWNLARHGFRREAIRGAEALVAATVAEAIARQLDLAPGAPVVHGGRIDRDRLAELMIALGSRTTAELRSAAAAAWGREFGGRLARIYDDRAITPAGRRTRPRRRPRSPSRRRRTARTPSPRRRPRACDRTRGSRSARAR